MIKVTTIMMATLFLVACGGASHNTPSGGYEYHFTSSKGVECIFMLSGYGGGLSCNWQKYNKEERE